ncbi:MAG: phosphoserine phosphatase SerB [Candidatus Nanopelagicales bacterium]
MADPAPTRTTTLHATVVGVDRPGVTQAMFAALASTTVLDVEQVVVAGQLLLGAVILAPENRAPELLDRLGKAVPEFAVDIRAVHSIDIAGAIVNAVVTIVGNPVPAEEVSALAGVMAEHGTNIVRIDRVADYPVTALALEVATKDLAGLRDALNLRSRALSVDIAVAPRGLTRRGIHLVVMDVDSTLIQDEVIEILARFAGREDEVREITEAAMRGELDFTESLRARVALLEGLPESVIARGRAQIRLTPGARTLCRTLHLLGYRIALVSGGFTEVIAPLAAELEVDHLRANGLEIVDGRLTGKLSGPIIDRAAKAAALREFAAEHAISPDATIAIGDGANDLDMLAAAGHGIAFNAKPLVQAAAATAINVPYLDTVLYLMGITREEVEIANGMVTEAG